MQDLRGVLKLELSQRFCRRSSLRFLDIDLCFVSATRSSWFVRAQSNGKGFKTHLCRLVGRLFSLCFPVLCLLFELEIWLSENLVLECKA